MAVFPPPSVDTIHWNDPQDFEVHDVNGYIESTYSRATGKWTPLKFVRGSYVQVHGLSPVLNYGQQALEGLKAFRTASGDIDIFRPAKNAARLQHSAEALSMPAVPVDMFLKACRAAVALNAAYVPPHESGGSLYLRPQLFASSPMFPPTIGPSKFTFSVFVLPTLGNVMDGAQPVRALILDEMDRAAPRGIGHAKVGGNYAPVLRWAEKAREEGFGITLHLDSARHEEIDEFSTCGFIGVKHNGDINGREVTLAVPDSPCVIDSVTSNSIQAIARSFGWTVEKRSIPYTELPTFNEVLGAGTGVSLASIRSITRRSDLGTLPSSERVRADTQSETITYLLDDDKNGGPVWFKLRSQLKAIQMGKVEDTFGWRVKVTPEDLQVPVRED